MDVDVAALSGATDACGATKAATVANIRAARR